MALAERVARLSPDPRSKVFLTSGGSDSVDTAAKITRRYFQLTGEPERTVLITRSWAYHGMHGYGTSLAGITGNADGVGPLVPDVLLVPWDSADALADAINEVGPERIAGFFCEPVIGAGGVRPRRRAISKRRVASSPKPVRCSLPMRSSPGSAGPAIGSLRAVSLSNPI